MITCCCASGLYIDKNHCFNLQGGKKKVDRQGFLIMVQIQPATGSSIIPQVQILKGNSGFIQLCHKCYKIIQNVHYYDRSNRPLSGLISNTPCSY